MKKNGSSGKKSLKDDGKYSKEKIRYTQSIH